MAIQTAGDVTIVDLVDCYSIHFALEEYRRTGGMKLKVFVIHGNQYETSEIDEAKITAPEGVTVTTDNSSGYPLIDVEITDPEKAEGTVAVPISIHHGTMVIYKDIPIR